MPALDVEAHELRGTVWETLLDGALRRVRCRDVVGNALGASLANSNSSSQSSAGEQALTAAQAQTSGGFDSDAAYAQMVDAFSAMRNGYAANTPSPLLAANDITQPGQPVVVTVAGDDDGGYHYQSSYIGDDGITVNVVASRPPFDSTPHYADDYVLNAPGEHIFGGNAAGRQYVRQRQKRTRPLGERC